MAPTVLFAPKPVNDATDVYVVRVNETTSGREALVADLSTYDPEQSPGPGWWPVSTGDEAPSIGRLPGACGVDLDDLVTLLQSAQDENTAAAARSSA